MSRVKAFLSAPVVKKAVTAFVLAVVPLLFAAVEKDGVKGITVAVVMAAVIAGLHAAVHAFQAGSAKRRAQHA